MVAHASRRRFGKEHRAPRKPGYGPQAGLMKHRELRFSTHGFERIDEAGRFLAAIGNVTVTGRRGRALAIEYSLAEHSFRSIEKLLRAQGFLLDSSFSMRLIRAVEQAHGIKETK